MLLWFFLIQVSISNSSEKMRKSRYRTFFSCSILLDFSALVKYVVRDCTSIFAVSMWSIFIFIFIMIWSHGYKYTCSFAVFLEYDLLFSDKECELFSKYKKFILTALLRMCQLKKVAYSKKCLCINLYLLQLLRIIIAMNSF